MTYPATVQNTYALFPAVAFAGQMSDSGRCSAVSCIASAPVTAGTFVSQTGGNAPSTGDRTVLCGPPTQASDVTNLLLGVARREAYRMPNAALAAQFAIGDTVPVQESGRIWVKVDPASGGAVVDRGPIFVVNSGANAGTIRPDTGSGGTAATAFTRGRVVTGGPAGGIAEISINIP